LTIRNLVETDYDPVIAALDEWWGGRRMTDMLPRLFFKHFNDTSFVIIENNEVVAFLVGFLSQAHPNQAYVHFTGVHPEYRKKGFAARLYQTFFAAVRQKGCDTVSLVTSPVNKNSVAFHTRIGFRIETGDSAVGGLAVNTAYDGPGEDRVLLVKALD
jgi:ribosomal protein S18 acetylase RimI-like enzyme